MKKVPTVIALVLMLTLGYLAGSRHSGQPATAASAEGRKVLYYHDPMHPAYKSDHPGIAPDCGMQLEPVYADGDSGEARPDSSLPPGAIRVSTEKQQVIGVQTGLAQRNRQRTDIRILGRVVADETRVYPFKAPLDGWINAVYPNSIGSLVRKGQPLASFYAPEFLKAEQDFVFALNSLSRVKVPDSPAQFQLPDTRMQVTLDILHNLGMDDTQIEELKSTRKFTENIIIRAPQTGFVEVREVAPGLRFQKGTELYRIVDLSRVWILADVFESEAASLKPGLTVQAANKQLGRSFTARVSEVLPRFDPATRTLKVRLEADNPGFALKPDMFLDINCPLDLPPSLTVPAEAVLDTGRSKSVFVATGGGYFEPRTVETGWRHGNEVEITRGLKEGEQVVISGNFLLDSESRMKAAAAGISGTPGRDPVCGMDVDAGKAILEGRTSPVAGRIFYFCSDDCKKSFDKVPAQYLSRDAVDSDTRGRQ